MRFLAFSAHADAKGILQLVAATNPRAAMLVHGDKPGMHFLASRINKWALYIYLYFLLFKCMALFVKVLGRVVTRLYRSSLRVLFLAGLGDPCFMRCNTQTHC